MKTMNTNFMNLVIGLIVIFGIMTALSPKGHDGIPTLLGKDNLLVMLGFCTFNIILGTGMTFVIITGGIDLSVGRCLALCNVTFAMILNATGSLALASLSAVLAGAAIGFLNGLITVVGRIPSFIATLGMYMICWGLAYVVSGGQTITTKVGGALLPFLPILLPLAAMAVSHVFLSNFKFGRYVYAVGGNVQAARLSGIGVKQVQILAFMICGVCAGIGGIIYWAKLGTGSSLAGEAFELYAIAAVIIGGTSLSGGEGTVIGTFIGALIMGVLREGLVILHVSEHWQKVIFGAVIIGAVSFDSFRRRRR